MLYQLSRSNAQMSNYRINQKYCYNAFVLDTNVVLQVYYVIMHLCLCSDEIVST